MSVPFVDMHRLHAETRADMLDAFARVLDSGSFVQGREVQAFEEEFRFAYPAKYALAVSNGTNALHLALLAKGVGPGDEVITVANTFIATAEAISMAGATPVFADITHDGFNIEPAEVERRITERTKAIIAVHLYGRMAPMRHLLEIARPHGLALIEDACQAHGATLDVGPAGTIGDVGCFSFYPTKNLGTVGEGGLIVTSDEEVAARVASLRDHGQAGRHNHIEPGYNYRMPELQAAALRVLLPRLQGWNAARVALARCYDAGLRGAGVVTPGRGDDGEHVYHLYVVRSKARAELQAHLNGLDIATAIHYPRPIHLQPAYASPQCRRGCLPYTERAVSEIISLPMHPSMTADEVDRVCEGIHEFSRTGVREPVGVGA